MKFLKFSFIFLLIGSFIGFPIYYFFFIPATTSLDHLYSVEVPSLRDIKQTISATGVLKLKNEIKIGSVVAGRIKAIHVDENDPVTEGQLLVEIDTGLGDTEVREALATYEKALAELDYQESNYQRQSQLFEEHFISEAALQEAKRHYRVTLAEVKALKASYEKKVIAYENSKIYAPDSGIVIHIAVTKGEKVSSDLEGGFILSMAPDVKQIEVELDIHEKDIGQIQKGQKVQMVVDTYPHKVFESAIQNISFTAKEGKDKECLYQAKAYIENPHLLLRPGMSVNATIDVASTESALALTSQAFLIKLEHLQPIAKLLNYSIKSIEKQEKQALLKKHSDQQMQFVWQACENCFQEMPIEIGMTDHIHFQVTSGLKGNEQLVSGVIEDDEMQKIYEKFYRKL